MPRADLDRMLEQAVAEAIGVPYRSPPVTRVHKPRSPASHHPVHPAAHAGSASPARSAARLIA